uniref:G-protein coupled receptors family 1 profile domain-containing protein n=1 Tax=Rhinopithecus bieti TaxID=61621 RepID=A0A2K6KW41_RHIBE
MEWENQTILVEFFLKGLSGYPRLKLLLFALIFIILLSERKTISFSGCAVQMFLGLAIGTTECVLLGVTAFDRYVAICNPLRYPIIMSKDAYVSTVVGSCIIGAVNSAVQTVFVIQLPFCRNNIINHFTYEILAVMKLACADISGNEFIMLMATTLFILTPLLLIIVSYTLIIVSIFQISSSEERSKAFSTCSAHLTVVIIFCGTFLSMYMKPKFKETIQMTWILRNKDVKESVKLLLRRKVFNK